MIPSYALEPEDCHRVSVALARAGDKWAIFVLMNLETGAKRFNELRHAIEGASQKMLTLTLRGLERDGYVTRTVYPTKPPSVEYKLTHLGEELLVPVKALGFWVLSNLNEIESARLHFDETLSRIQMSSERAERFDSI